MKAAKYGSAIALSGLGLLLFFAIYRGISFELRDVTYAEDLSDLRWADDGSTVEFLQNEVYYQTQTNNYQQWGTSTVFRYYLESGLLEQARVIHHGDEYFEPTTVRMNQASPDGTTVASWGFDTLALTDIDSKETRYISGGFQKVHTYRWSPDSRTIAIVGGGKRGVFLIDIESGESQRIYHMSVTPVRMWNLFLEGWPLWAFLAPLCFIVAVRAIKIPVVRHVVWTVFTLYYVLCLGLLCTYTSATS